MKYILHWNREKNWKERCLMADAPERSVEQKNDLDAALKNPLKFRLSHLREMEGDLKNISPEQKRDFRDMAGYFLSLKQRDGGKKLPPQMLVQIEKSPLFSFLSQKMQEQIKNVLDKQLEELVDFSEKSIQTPAKAIRATTLYRRLRSRVHNDPRLKSAFAGLQKKLIEWSIEQLRTGSISTQVQETLVGVKRNKSESKGVSKQEKLIIADVYRMFPDAEDWVNYCDAQSARAFAMEAIQALKESPTDPTMMLSWNLVDEWMAEGNTEMISLLTQKFTPEQLSQFIGRTRAIELLQFAQTQAPFLPAHLQALNALKNEPEWLPEQYSEVTWQELSPAAEKMRELGAQQEKLKQEYEESREEEIQKHEQRYPQNPEVLEYEEAVEKRATAINSCWDEHMSQLDEVIKRWDNISKFEVQAAEARRDTLAGKLDITDTEKDLERKKKYQEDQDKYIENYKKQLEESLEVFKALKEESIAPETADIEKKEELIQKFQKSIREKLPYSTNYGVTAQPEEDATLLKYIIEGLKSHEEEVKKQEETKENAIKKMPFSESFSAKNKKYEEDFQKLKKQKEDFVTEIEAQEEWHAIFSNPGEYSNTALEKFWKGIQERLDNRQLHAADFEILWNDEFAEEVAEKVQDLPEFETIQRFRDAFEGALNGIFDGLSFSDDKYETWYEALDQKLSYENLIELLQKQNFDVQKEFKNPQKISEVLEGAITQYRETIFDMVKDSIPEEKQDEFYSKWDRLHGRLSAPVTDPTVVSAEHSKYEREKISTDKHIQSEQEKNLSIIEGLKQRAAFLKDTNPALQTHLEEEAKKLEEAWEVRKKWYSEGGQMSIETVNGQMKNVWAPGKKVLAEMALQAGGVEKEIASVLENDFVGPIRDIQKDCAELSKETSAVETKRKQADIREKFKNIFTTWPQQKTKLGRFLNDHETILKGLIPDGEALGFQFVLEVAAEGKSWLEKIDERMHVWKKNAQSNNYLYHGDEEVFRMLPAAAQSLRSVIDFNQGKFVEESNRLDDYLEKDTETVEFLDEEKFFTDSSVDRREFKAKYNEMAQSFESNIKKYEAQFKKVRARLRKDIDRIDDNEFTFRYKGIPRESMEELLMGHDEQLGMFQKGSAKFLSPDFFNNWLRRYESSPESRANALDEMSQFRSLETWSQEAEKQAVNMERWINDWDEGKGKTLPQYQRFSIYDIYALVKQAVEVNRRRWERKSERAVAEIGVSFFGRNSPWGKEFHRKSQDAEEARVKEIQTEKDEDPWWETQQTLYETNDEDEAKACINLLIEKGVFKWDDPKLWKTFMRLSNNAVNFSDKDKYLDFSEILEKCRNVIEFIWTKETFRQWDTTLDSKIKSKEDEFADDFQRLEHHKTARVAFLSNVLTRWSKGERSNTDPAKYGCFLRKAFELGKLNGGPLYDSRWYFLIQGVKMGILSRDFFGRLNGELLGNMPFFDFFIDKSASKKNGRIVPEGTPGSEVRAWNYGDYESWADMLHKDGEPYSVETARKRTKEFFYEVILQSQEGRARMERKVREGTKVFDHDDGAMFAAGLGVESIRQMLNRTSTDEDKYTPDFWRNIMSGYVPYFHGISKFIREGDAEYGLQNQEWQKIRKQNFAQVADKMQAMLLVFHSVVGNINITNREPSHFSTYDFQKSEEMSPSAEKSLGYSEAMLKTLLKGTGKEHEYDIIFDQSEWLAPKGEIPPAKEEKTIAMKKGDGKNEGNPNHISVKLHDLIKGEDGKEIFSAQNVERFLTQEGGNIDTLFTDFADGVEKPKKRIDLSGNVGNQSQAGSDGFGDMGMAA